MNRLLVTIAVAAMAGAVAALAAALISRLTAGTLSPLAGAAIGVAFGITAGNIVGSVRGGQRSIAAALSAWPRRRRNCRPDHLPPATRLNRPQPPVCRCFWHTPRFDAATRRRSPHDLFGVHGRVEPLTSERDQNFLINTAEAARPENRQRPRDRSMLEAQNAAMATSRAALDVPARHPGEVGDTIREASGHFVRLLAWVDGVPMARRDSTPRICSTASRHLRDRQGARQLRPSSHPSRFSLGPGRRDPNRAGST